MTPPPAAETIDPDFTVGGEVFSGRVAIFG
jgi:hypothetical protein